MGRSFVSAPDLAGLLREYRPGSRLAGLVRLPGGSKKGVYRLTLADESTVILYAWNDAENYWPSAPSAPDDPFSDATGARGFRACHEALAAAGVRIPAVYALDLSRRHYPADLALIEDLGGGTLEHLLTADPAAAERVLGLLGETLQAMAGQRQEWFGKVAPAGRADGRERLSPGPDDRAEDAVLRRALRLLDLAAVAEPRLAAVRPEVASLVRRRRAAVPPRREYGLVHGELGPDHVLLDSGGAPALIDIEGLTWFDVEWEHAFLRLRFGEGGYRRLGLPSVDEARVSFYDLAQRISLVEGPLRIAQTDFPDRDWMLDLARWHTGWLLAAVGHRE